jgi:vacuolar protein-sorting-associated protein 4
MLNLPCLKKIGILLFQKQNCLKYFLIKLSFSGSDLTCLVRNAIMEPIRRIQKSKYFKLMNGFYIPCEENETNAEFISLKNISPHLIKSLPITISDFESSLKSMKSSICKEDVEKQEVFMNKYGSQ